MQIDDLPRLSEAADDELSAAIAERQAALTDMRTAGSDFARFSAASKREAELAARIRHLRPAESAPIGAVTQDGAAAAITSKPQMRR